MINVTMKTQPNDVTCGPTSLQAIYRYYGDSVALKQVIAEVEYVSSGGTLASLLGKHALGRDYDTTLYTYNLNIFDPSWFSHGKSNSQFLIEKLTQQITYKNHPRMKESTTSYMRYLQAGGEIRFRDLTVNLLKYYFEQNIPLITGLSATYLYQSMREYDENGTAVYDDLRGEPCGHFVVLCGYDETKRHVIVADPHRANPLSHDNYYKVNINKLINAMLLGVITYDGNVLVITPRKAVNANVTSD